MNIPFALQMLVAVVLMPISVHFAQAGKGRSGRNCLKLVWKLNILQVQINNSRVPVKKFHWINGKITL